MILVDSSVWIDYFNGNPNPESNHLDSILGSDLIITGDLILTEILQGFRKDHDYNLALSLLEDLPVYTLGGKSIALKAARNYRQLRKKGVTPRKTIDMIIGTFCIENCVPLLFRDRDFLQLVDHLGLRSAL